MQKWEDKWLMQFNPSKCNVIWVTHKRNVFESHYNIHGTLLENKSCVKYLGVNIDSKLSWKRHIDITAQKADSVRAFIGRNLQSSSRVVKAQCCTTLVRPIVEYASTIWDPHTTESISKLERIQRRCARTVFGIWDRDTCVTQLLEELKWNELGQRRKQTKLIMFYKILHGYVEVCTPNYLLQNQSRTRGHDKRFLVPQGNSEVFNNSFFPSAIRLWNKLAQETIAAESVSAFKTAIASARFD